MLTQSDKEALWHNREYARILEHDMPFIAKSTWLLTPLSYRGEFADILQECFLSCHLSITKWRPDGGAGFLKLFNWACRSALSRIMRKEVSHDRNSKLAADMMENTRVVFTRGSGLLSDALATLSDIERQSVLTQHSKTTYYTNDMQRLADRLGVRQQTVSAANLRALKKLRAYMEDRGE